MAAIPIRYRIWPTRLSALRMILPGLIWLWLLAKIRTDGDMPTVIAVVLLAAACVGGELWQMLDSEKEFRGKYTTVTE